MQQEQKMNLFDICTLIKGEIKASADSFVSIGYWLKEIKSRKLYRETGHKDIYEFATAQFGFSKSTASRFMNINDRFSIDGNSPELESRYEEFSSSQLSEMLTLSDSQLEQVSAETTVKEIRKMKPKKEKKCDAKALNGTCSDCFYYKKVGCPFPKEKELLKCRQNPDYVCGIVKVMEEHFLVKGNIEGCTGCCQCCLEKEKCKYVCDYVKDDSGEENSVATSQQTAGIETKQEKRRYVNPPPSLPDGWYRKVPLGKKDCEGKEIKEGDILESQTNFPAGIFYVVWHPIGVGFKAVLKKHVQPDGTAEDNIACISSDQWHETRIIGSVYDSEEVQE